MATNVQALTLTLHAMNVNIEKEKSALGKVLFYFWMENEFLKLFELRKHKEIRMLFFECFASLQSPVFCVVLSILFTDMKWISFFSLFLENPLSFVTNSS